MQRVFLLILDGVGVGALPDAAQYHDVGSNTLSNTAKQVHGLNMPNLQKLGLGNIIRIKGVPAEENPLGDFGKAIEVSAGKDSTTGHWEIMGVINEYPFPTYPPAGGFPKEVIDAFIEKTGCEGVLGNKAASGTEIINELGEEHLKTGFPIVYTSADSVFQIAAHEKIYPLKKLYKMCEVARNEILIGKHRVGRVIARPFIGDNNKNFQRTGARKDFSVNPPSQTVMDLLTAHDIPVIGVGKIEDLFNFQGITESIHTPHNQETMDMILSYCEQIGKGLIFANLPDFDTLWGHRNNFKSFASGLEKFDSWLPQLFDRLTETDVIMITADHGCDPTTKSTDHSREYVPILVYGKSIKSGIDIGVRKTFADIGATIAEMFQIKGTGKGTGFWDLIK
ncbi:MAG: phosphopentomutase [Candidatus Celaenobacter antarcticus]|nr:phosphopentomutase [Candidatus Celaenobacter antarcticus]